MRYRFALLQIEPQRRHHDYDNQKVLVLHVFPEAFQGNQLSGLYVLPTFSRKCPFRGIGNMSKRILQNTVLNKVVAMFTSTEYYQKQCDAYLRKKG